MEGKAQKVQSNEEVVEELVKDLESSCVVDKDGLSKAEDTDSDVRKSISTDDPWEPVGGERGDNEGDDAKGSINEEEKNRSDDFVDEEALKEREERLSEAEKEGLKADAEKLKNEGNTHFKNGNYIEAISIYTQGLQTCPLAYSKERSILYANRAAAKAKSLAERESAIADCTKAIELNTSYVKAYVRRAQLYEETEKLEDALQDYKTILTFDPSHTEANYAVRRLPPMIQEANEKLKTEMLGKLKDLGNMVLKPFGLSTSNFQLQQDPSSGGYSVKFNPSTT
ncbi:hypothetical protein KM043_006734 [Ampulex compressa]|nr:hypothetical protein KM043_006734 [Ampulex compressa]